MALTGVENLARLPEVDEWVEVVRNDRVAAVAAEDRDFVATARTLLPDEPWDETTWTTWTAAVSSATGRKGKALFLPLRRALTGRDHGPEMKRLLPVIGRKRTSARLS